MESQRKEKREEPKKVRDINLMERRVNETMI